MPSSKQFHILVSGSAPSLYPVDTMFALLYYGRDAALEIPKRYPYSGEWGEPESTHLLEREQYPVPGLLDMVWLSVVERKFYSLVHRLPVEHITSHLEKTADSEGSQLMDYIIIGMAPYGGMALWLYGQQKSVLVEWQHAEPTMVSMEDFMPQNPELSIDEVCDYYIENSSRVRDNLKQNGLPPRNLYDKYMQQFSYRYVILYEYWDEGKEEWQKYDEDETIPEFGYIEEALFDGTHDKLHDGELMKYHNAGKPKKLAVKWHVKKSDYTAYFWFEDEEIRSIFDRFYGAHPETKMDFMIRIDAENNKYELALYRYGLKEPSVIPESAYQLIVFKNKFESFRSENYAQERGAWIW